MLERIRGFFNHLAIAYDTMLSFLKGFHNTIDGWRDNRDEEGWKIEGSTWKRMLDYQLFEYKITEEEHELLAKEKGANYDPLKSVVPVPRLFDDIEMLLKLMEQETPPKFLQGLTKSQRLCTALETLRAEV